MNDNYDYFFQTTNETQASRVLFLDESNLRAGINEESPQYDLEVATTIRTSNLITDTLSLVNSTSPSNFKNTLFINGCNLSVPMPDTTGVWNGIDWWFNEERKNAPIHPSWIQDDQNILADLWNAGELGVDIAQTLKDAFDFFTAASNALTDAAIQTIQDLLDNALDNSNASLSINWANLTNKPIARNNYNVGMRGDLFMTSNTKIRALPTSLSIDQWNNPQFIGSPSGATLIDIGSREAFLKYLTLSNTDTSTLYTADEIIPTASNFKLYTLRFSSNSIRNSTSNIVINGITMCNDTMEESVVEADKFFASRYVAPEGKGSALTFFTSQTTLKHQNTTPSNALDWRFSQLQMTDREFKYEKYASVNEGGAQTILFQANSNGEFYTYSNWRTNSPAVIRAIETSIDDFPREALFFMNNTNFRWIRRTVVSNSNQDTISASFSSNGLLLGERPALFGKVETVLLNPLLSNDFIVKFPRLEYSFSNGLTYGYGFCQNPIMGDYDIFNVSYKGEISTLNHQNFLMRQILNSNANLTTNLIINSNVSLTSNGGLSINNRTSLTSNGLTVSNLTIASNGAIFYNGKEFLNEAGSLRMRTFTDPSSNQGLTISTGGIVQINGSEFQITNDGIATIRQPITASNISTSNMTVASNLTASNLSASNAVLSNLRLHNKTMTVNSGGTDFLASNSTQSNCSFNFINQQSIGNYSYLYVNPVHNQGGDNPYTNVGVFTYSNNLSQGLGRLNLQGTVLYNFTRLEDQFAPSNILSNLATSNNIAALSNSLSNVNSNFLTFSNWTNTQYSRSNDLSNLSSNLALLSNSLSNVNSNWQTFSNWTNSQYSRSNQLSNYTTVSTFNSYSNYADGAFRKVSVQVPWTQISGKPNFSDCNDSLSIGGAVLGAAGLTLGTLALLNQNGQLTDILANAANSLRLNPNGYSRFNDGLEVLDTASGLPRISLDPSGAFSALTGNFSQGARFGQFSITLSNDLIIFGSNTTSNMVLSSNSLTVRNNLPFTFSNANVIFANCNLVVNALARASNILSLNGVAIGTSNPAPIWTAVVNNNLAGNTFFGTATSNMYLWRVVNEDIDINSNQIIGGITLRTYNTVGSAPYQFPDRQLYGLGFVVRNGLNSNIEALSIDNRGRLGIGTSNPSYPLDIVSTSNLALRVSGSNSLADFRSPSVFIANSTNNPGIASFYAPNLNSNTQRSAALNFGVQHQSGDLISMLFSYVGTGNTSNSLIFGFWGGVIYPLTMRFDGRIGINNLNPTQMLDVNGAALVRSNLTTSNILASNITLAGIDILTRFAPSNQLSNYTLSNDFVSFSNWTNTQYARSNQLSNYAPSNAMSNWNFASNTAVWSSNNFANFAPSGNFADTSNYAYTDRYWTWNSAVFTNSNVSISSNQYLEFGTGISKQADAGRVAYRRYGDSNSLDIVGAGTTAGARRVKIWNILSIQNGTIEGQDGSGLTISGFNQGINFVGLGHSNQAGNVGTYAIGQDLNAQTFINANSNQSVNFRINDTNRAIMNSNGNFIMDRRLVIASNIAVDGSAFSFTTTTGGNLAIFYANSYNYLAAPGADGSSNLFAIQKNGDVAINRGDLSITNRNHTFLIQCGMKGGTSNNLWTTIDPSSHVYQYGDIELNGTLTAINKNFTINHPILPNKKLIHSSVESPQHDLMYSGMTTLSNGIATVNLDSDGCPFSPMTAGTFEALTKNTRFFLQNKTGWTALKGDISGATLTITSQDPTDDDVYFCVVAERKDTQILESSSTYNGHLITQIDA